MGNGEGGKPVSGHVSPAGDRIRRKNLLHQSGVIRIGAGEIGHGEFHSGDFFQGLEKRLGELVGRHGQDVKLPGHDQKRRTEVACSRRAARTEEFVSWKGTGVSPRSARWVAPASTYTDGRDPAGWAGSG